MANKLEEARRIINEVDAQMAELFVKRMKAAELVFEHKKEFGLPILDPKREQAVLETNTARIEPPVFKGYYRDFLTLLMGLSRAYQSRLQNGLRVAYSGVEGAFAHIAAEKIFPEAEKISHGDFAAAYQAVADGACDAVVLPIENSYVGEVGQTLDLIFSGELFINGIYELEVHQNLLALPEANMEDVRVVVSHPQALSQCHDFLSLHGFATEEAPNTALAAKTVAEGKDKSRGAIASLQTARLYGLKVLASNVNESGENTTRFAVLSKVRAASPTLTSTILMLTVKHEAGSLAKAVHIIGRHGYNMTALRSRPMKQHSWQYYFYVEIDGTVECENGQKMIRQLRQVCDQLKIAGSFAPHSEL